MLINAISVSSDMSLGELIVGLGTAGLAVVTWLLARKAGEEVKLTRKSLTLTRESIEAGDRPCIFLIERFDDQPHFQPVPEGFVGPDSGAGLALVCELENLGRGPGIFDGVRVWDVQDRQLVDEQWNRETPLKPGETASMGFALLSPDEPPEGAELTLRLSYRSASGAQYETTHGLHVEARGRVTRLGFRRSLLALGPTVETG